MEETLSRYATRMVALKEEITEYEFEISWFRKKVSLCKDELVIYQDIIDQILNDDNSYLYYVWEERIY
jgi:hypothetical protein